MKNACIGINDGMAITAFLDGISSGLLRHKLVRAQPSTLNQLIIIATKYVVADDDARIWEEKMRRTANFDNKRKAPAEEKSGSDIVAITTGGRGISGGGRGQGRGSGPGGGQMNSEAPAAENQIPYEQWRDMPCRNHLRRDGTSTHTNRTCHRVNDLKNDPDAGFKRRRKNKARKSKADKEEKSGSDMEEDTDPKPKVKANPYAGKKYTFLGTPTAKARKSTLRVLHAATPPTSRFLKWSEYDIT